MGLSFIFDTSDIFVTFEALYFQIFRNLTNFDPPKKKSITEMTLVYAYVVAQLRKRNYTVWTVKCSTVEVFSEGHKNLTKSSN